MKNLSNLKRSLLTLRKKLVEQINVLDRTLITLNNSSSDIPFCPKCFSRDLRCMTNNKIFCRACGYDNRKQMLVETK